MPFLRYNEYMGKKIVSKVVSYVKETDLWLWLMCIALSAFSLILLFGIYRSELVGLKIRSVYVQAFAVGLGSFCAIILSKFDHHTLGKLWKLHVPLAYTLVLLTFVIGVGTPARPEDKSWIVIPGTSQTIQPTEFLKIAFIVALAYHIYQVRDHINRPQTLALVCLHGAIPVLLVHFQGDDGTALVIFAIFICILFASGISWTYVAAATAGTAAVLPLAWIFVLNDDQKARITVLSDPNANPLGIIFQQYSSKLAIGSGQVWGKGIFAADHKYVPAEETDFIFSFLAESIGFVGCLAVFAIIACLLLRILVNAERAPDLMGRLICVGVFGMFAIQTVVNLGMCLSILPVIGITLPFLSYGGSSMLTNFLGIGLVLSVYMHTSNNLFSKSHS